MAPETNNKVTKKKGFCKNYKKMERLKMVFERKMRNFKRKLLDIFFLLSEVIQKAIDNPIKRLFAEQEVIFTWFIFKQNISKR